MLFQHRTNHRLDHCGPDGVLAELPAARLLGMLGRDHHGPDRDGTVFLVFHRHLGLAVGSEPLDRGQPVQSLAHRGQPLGHPVGQDDRQRHALPGFPRGVAEHHALIAGALGIALAVDPHRDVGRLPVDRGEHGAGPAVETVGGVGVPDALHSFPHDVRNVHVGGGGDLPGDHRHAGRHHRLTGHPGSGIPRKDGVEHGIGNLIGNLVGVAFGDRLGREDVATGHREGLGARG